MVRHALREQQDRLELGRNRGVDLPKTMGRAARRMVLLGLRTGVRPGGTRYVQRLDVLWPVVPPLLPALTNDLSADSIVDINVLGE
jgi:hypothetical protein